MRKLNSVFTWRQLITVILALGANACSPELDFVVAVGNGAQTDECDSDCRVELGGPVEITASPLGETAVISSIDASPPPAEFAEKEEFPAELSGSTLLATASGDGQTEISIESENSTVLTVRLNLITE
jgi:hypothetical protein